MSASGGRNPGAGECRSRPEHDACFDPEDDDVFEDDDEDEDDDEVEASPAPSSGLATTLLQWSGVGLALLLSPVWLLMPRIRAKVGAVLLLGATFAGRVGMMRILLALGADPNGLDPMKMGVVCEDEEGQVVEEHAPRLTGKTVLMRARTRAAGQLLIERGADPHACDLDGTSVLMNACFHAEPNLIEYLLEQGVDVNARNNAGLTPLDMARLAMRPRIAAILRRAGGVKQAHGRGEERSGG